LKNIPLGAVACSVLLCVERFVVFGRCAVEVCLAKKRHHGIFRSAPTSESPQISRAQTEPLTSRLQFSSPRSTTTGCEDGSLAQQRQGHFCLCHSLQQNAPSVAKDNARTGRRSNLQTGEEGPNSVTNRRPSEGFAWHFSSQSRHWYVVALLVCVDEKALTIVQAIRS